MKALVVVDVAHNSRLKFIRGGQNGSEGKTRGIYLLDKVLKLFFFYAEVLFKFFWKV